MHPFREGTWITAAAICPMCEPALVYGAMARHGSRAISPDAAMRPTPRVVWKDSHGRSYQTAPRRARICKS
jgi:hypothetical protein